MKPTQLYKTLYEKFGDLYWWPMDKEYHKKNNSDPRFEVIVGAILTQNTSWDNVEKSLEKIKSKKKLDIKKIIEIDEEELKALIRSSGFFNQKSKRLKMISEHIFEKYQNLDVFFDRETENIRKELLDLNGIGPETADSILLYAGDKPIFVVDAYTKRICQRIPINADPTYEEIQKYFSDDLKKNFNEDKLVKIFNELHAQIVILAKTYCTKKPKCKGCPLEKKCKKNF